jgi:hypothetical protein
MPMHDWTRVKAGTYHNFHYRWIAAIMDRLNAGLLPPGFFAMAEQIIGQPETDVVTLQTPSQSKSPSGSPGTLVASSSPPKTRFVFPLSPDHERYAQKARRIAIHHELGNVVAVIEIVSPGNKDRRHSLRAFVDKAADLFWQRVNLLIIDPFPPGPHDPQGINKAICDELAEELFELPRDQPITLAAYQVEPVKTVFAESIAVGDRLPNMPLFLEGDLYVWLPLEETYQATWNVLPAQLRNLLEPPTGPKLESSKPRSS